MLLLPPEIVLADARPIFDLEGGQLLPGLLPILVFGLLLAAGLVAFVVSLVHWIHQRSQGRRQGFEVIRKNGENEEQRGGGDG